MADDEKHEGGHSGGHGGGGHGGGGSHEEHEGAPEWLISFADNVALMMGFFVVLLAANMKPTAAVGGGDSRVPSDVTDLAIAIREAFNNPVDVHSSSPEDLALIQRLVQRRSGGPADAEQPGVKGSEHDVQSIRPSDYYGQGGAILFERNSSELTPAARQSIDDVVKAFRGMRCVIDVRGHVSSAESIGREDRGQPLSYARAMAVAKALVDHGIGWEQLRVMACGDADRATPIATDDAAHQTNQRVEIVGTDRQVPDYIAPTAPAAKP